MRLSDNRVNEILKWWRKQTFWNKFLFAICHPDEWMSVTCLDKADKQARQAMLDRVFNP